MPPPVPSTRSRPPIRVQQLAETLARLAPVALAESWDNVGLLVGDRSAEVRRAMTCLTVTPPVVSEAIERQVQLIVAHHPLPFRPLARITADTTAGEMLLRLIAGGVALYSAHTAFDSAAAGINQQIAERIGLQSIAPLQPIAIPAASAEASPETSAGAAVQRAASANPPSSAPELGTGRWGVLDGPESLRQLAQRIARQMGAGAVRVVGQAEGVRRRVGVACGSGGSLLDAARRRGCDVLVTGEATFHVCLEAESTGVGLILLGHYASERFAMEGLAAEIGREYPHLEVWASERESDPLWVA